MSLTLSRKPGQSIRVGNEVFTTMVQCSRGELPIFIDAPKQEQIVHGETEETGGHPDSRRDRRSRASRARRLKRCARHRRGYRKSGTAVGFIRPCKAAMPRALPPLELRRDALAFAIRRRPSRGFRFRRSCRSRVTQQAEFLESVFSGFAPTGVLLRCGASFRHRSAFIFTTHGTRFRSAQKDDAMITTVGPPMKLTPLLTVREAADVLRISERTLWSLTNAKKLPSVRVGRSVRYDQNDLATWIASQKTVS